MVRFLSLGLSLVILAGCGADGAPVRPTGGADEAPAQTGVSVSGYGTVGVVYD
ncbi:hypothetical protein [Lentibacter sp.]|mgnify:CR=1 FL=1|uniref:hypothetical protein n=1 Tax=Lentibacter sp. TaxID=2024994 RepID=UPI003F69E38D